MRSIPVARVGLACGLAVCIASLSCAGMQTVEPEPGEPTHLLSKAEGETPAATTHRVARGDTVWSVAGRHGSCVSAILAENSIEDVRAVQPGTLLTVPEASACGSDASVAHHRVRPGDTASEIALLHGASTRSLLEANEIEDPTHLSSGSLLRVPLGAAARTAAPARTVPPAPGEAPAPGVAETGAIEVELVRVEPGETVWDVAVRQRTCVYAILSENPIDDVRAIQAGTVLRVPDAGRCDGTDGDAAVVARHRVRRGDTVARIARLYGTSTSALLEANEIRDARRLRVGSTLGVPLGATARSVAPVPVPRRVAEREPAREEPAVEAPAAPSVVARAPEAPETTDATPPPVSAAPPSEDAMLRVVNDALDVAQHHLRAAHFEEALASVEDAFWLLDANGEGPAPAHRARGHVLAATARLALAENAEARRSLELALRADPGLELDRLETPPRLLELLEDVQSEQRLARAP